MILTGNNFSFLQLFADAAAAGAEGATTGVTETVAVSQSGVKNDAPAAGDAKQEGKAVDRNAEFEKLIKGEYKDLYDARVQDTVQRRLKSTKDAADKYNALSPSLELLARKYGVDVTDPAALAKAIADDNSFYEDEAMKLGVSVESLKQVRRVERENEALKEQLRARETEQRTAQIYEGWVRQAEEAKAVYPALDLKTEIQNPQFARLLESGIDVQSAYMVVHKDEILPAVMQHAAKNAEEKLANAVASGQARPAESGMSRAASATTKIDPAKMTKEERAEINKRVARGEKIYF